MIKQKGQTETYGYYANVNHPYGQLKKFILRSDRFHYHL